MATGIVLGLSRQRDSWNSPTRSVDDTHNRIVSHLPQNPTMSSSNHHRSYSDAPKSLNGVRLPPISNLIEGHGRPDISHRPSYQALHRQPPFQIGLPQGRSPPIASDPILWSPGSDVRSSYQSQSPRYERGLVHDQYFRANDYRRASVPVPQLPSPDSVHNPAFGLPQQKPDPMGTSASATSRSVVREEIVPGKGPCYVYDDGSICQKIINGDTVNPKWGTTKAGKPRKRLGQACNTCREKKIKCDPSYPKCTQCLKFGRECRFEATSRIANKSPKMLTEDSPLGAQSTDDTARARRPSVALTEASSHSESGTVSSRAAGTADDSFSPLTNDSNFYSDTPGPSKKIRLTQTESEIPPALRPQTSDSHPQSRFDLEADPFNVDRGLTEAYLSLYFTNVNNSTFSLVPEHLFLKWAEEEKDKSLVSRLVLYCMLAVGSSFSKSSDKGEHQRIFSSIASKGVMQSIGHFSLQLIQARLIFALYEFQQGRDERAWDLCGAAMRTACAMNLNTEDGIAQQLRQTNPVYGLNTSRLAECMRRTFWMAYIMENLGVAYLYITTSSNQSICFLHLPCSTKAYESGAIPNTPMFDGEIQPSKPKEANEQANVSTLGYIVQISSLCCEVRTLAFKAQHRADIHQDKRHAVAREGLKCQLMVWEENYTAHIRRRYVQRYASQTEYPHSFGGLHLMYYHALMQLHRNMPHSRLSRTQISEHARMAYQYAEKTLGIAEQLTSRKSHDICDYHFAVSNPLSGYAVHYAIDILSAAGVNTRLLENQSALMGYIMNSVQLLDNLAEVWFSAKVQKKQVQDRVTFLNQSAMAGHAESKIGFCMEQPMVAQLARDEDLVYGVDRLVYLRSFSWAERIQSLSDLNAVSNKGKTASYSLWRD